MISHAGHASVQSTSLYLPKPIINMDSLTIALSRSGLATEKSKSIDLSHHYSHLANNRKPSVLKGLQKYLQNGVELISMAGGMPSPEYFPFADIGGDALISNSFPTEASQFGQASSFDWLWKFFGGNSEKTERITVPKYPVNSEDVSLAESLQYGPSSGIRQIQAIMKEFSTKVYRPATADFTTMISVGNTDAWNRVILTFCNPGDKVIVAEWTYVSAVGAMRPYGILPVPVALDSQGIQALSLRELLSTWNERHPGENRPHLLYTVPIGQNPTGSTMGAQRKKEIYDICVEYDVIICEDDPYYFLQEGEYVPKSLRKASIKNPTTEEYITSLSPSFLKFDYQGRVIRLDTFSKTIAPGCRMGWMTCSPAFAEKLEQQGESTTQQPCGFGQSLVCRLLQNWKHEGYVRWLQGLTAQYTSRRDTFIDLMHEVFDLRHSIGTEGAWKDCHVWTAHPKFVSSKHAISEKFSRKPMFSFTAPTSGMFIWMKLHFENMSKVDEESLEMQLFIKIAKAGVLVAPGGFFTGETDGIPPEGPGHFRLSFSTNTPEVMKKGLEVMDAEMRLFFN